MISQTRRTFLSTVAAGLALSAAPGAVAAKKSTDGVPTRPLGKTGEEVSVIGLGGFHLGIPDKKEAIGLIHAAIDQGITFMDNCWDYHGGESERRMGEALRGARRQQAFLMTKFDGRDRRSAAEQIDQSLRRLQTDVIDLMQIHEVIWPDDPKRVFAKGGAMEALLAAREAGKVRYIGFTGHKHPKLHLAMLRAARRHGVAFDAVQMPLNPFDAHYLSFEREVLPELTEHGVGVLGMKALGGGVLLDSGAVNAPECLRYALSLPTSVVITGIESRERLTQALDVATHFTRMTPEERAALLERTQEPASDGDYEKFKTATRFDGTARNPHWLSTAEP